MPENAVFVKACYYSLMFGDYYLRQAKMPDAEIARRAQIKEMQLRQVFVTVGAPRVNGPVANVAILGCPDKRLVAHHRRIFAAYFAKPVALTTFDLDVEHLAGEEGVIQHNVTEPLPGGPYDLIYSDLLLRFIPAENHLDVLVSSYEALEPSGTALHILAQEDIDPIDPSHEEWFHRVDLNALQLGLAKKKIQFLEVPARFETVLPGKDDKVLIDEFALVLRKT